MQRHMEILKNYLCPYVLCNFKEAMGECKGSIIHVEKMFFFFLLRIRAIKRVLCLLPLAPNALRENLTLTSNPLTQKRSNALRVYVAVHLTTRSVFMRIH